MPIITICYDYELHSWQNVLDTTVCQWLAPRYNRNIVESGVKHHTSKTIFLVKRWNRRIQWKTKHTTHCCQGYRKHTTHCCQGYSQNYIIKKFLHIYTRVSTKILCIIFQTRKSHLLQSKPANVLNVLNASIIGICNSVTWHLIKDYLRARVMRNCVHLKLTFSLNPEHKSWVTYLIDMNQQPLNWIKSISTSPSSIW